MLLAVDLANLYIPQFIGEIIDGITAGKLDMAGVGGIIFKILITGLIIMAGRFGWRYFIIGASRGIEYRLRDDMFSHMETLSARYYNRHKTGDLMAYFTNDLQAVRMGTGMAVITVFDAVIMTVMVLVKMVVYVDFKLTLFAFIPLIFIAIGCYFYGIESKKRQVKRQELSHICLTRCRRALPVSAWSRHLRRRKRTLSSLKRLARTAGRKILLW
mgnify:CR=1 FL=1